MKSPGSRKSEKGAVARAGRMIVGFTLGAAVGLVIHVVTLLAQAPVMDPGADWIFENTIGAPGAYILMILLGAFGARVGSGEWTVVGTMLYMSLIIIVVGFILYSATVMLPKNPSILNILLFLAEFVSLSFVIIYAYYTVDRVSRKSWRRHYSHAARTPRSYPFVEFHVPMYNEPPHVVMEVLDHLLRMDYPVDRYAIVVADDSTEQKSREEIERFCREHQDRIKYMHRAERKGYKAGALNAALERSPQGVELIAVVDADYKVQPEFLKEVVGYFEENPKLGFLQSPQDFHNRDHSPFTRQIYWANRFFYDAIMPARNEANSIIFCGTMGVMRKKALVDAGGWGEDVLCEDAETSLRMSDLGWESLYVPKVYGRGLIPETYSGYKSQQYRWAFGGGQILRKHGHKIWRSKLTPRQRFDLLAGGLHYFSGVIIFVIASILLLMGLGEIFGFPMVNYHRGEIALMGFVPLFVMLEGILRMRWALGRAVGLDMRQTLQVVGVWFSIMFFTTWAALKGISGSKQGFVRTPKHRARKVSAFEAWSRAVRLMRFEVTMAWWLLVAGFGVFVIALLKLPYLIEDGLISTISAFVLSFWLVWYAYVFGAGPIYAARGSRGPE
ncbi:MAG TPA: glycosyltransferase [Candidatus Thermoplasmatota archaeon]|nr:glycosyltransferase [Candidatus Thermoplasmatota archaeon]